MIAYTRTYTGQLADAASKASCIGLPPMAVASVKYQTILQGFYTDLSTALSVQLQLHITQSAKAQFTPAPAPMTIAAPVICAPLIAKAAPSSKLIDVSAKARTSILPPNGWAQVAPIVYEEFCKAVFTDCATVLSVAIATALNGAMVIVPPATAAAPVVATFAPIPAMITKPFVPALLQTTLMSVGFNPAMAKTKGAMIASQSQAQTAAMPPEPAGAIILETLLNVISLHIVQTLQMGIAQYITASAITWSVPPGVPGNPLIPPAMVPMMTAPMPAPDMCV